MRFVTFLSILLCFPLPGGLAMAAPKLSPDRPAEAAIAQPMALHPAEPGEAARLEHPPATKPTRSPSAGYAAKPSRRPAPAVPLAGAAKTPERAVALTPQENGKPVPESPAPVARTALEAPVVPHAMASAATEAGKSLAASYCSNIADAAAEARAAWQVSQIAVLERNLAEQIGKLEEKRREYESWFQRQEVQRRKADDAVVAIFARMRPDAAASQLSAMDEGVAGAVLAKINPKAASTILNEMAPGRAARLTDAMTLQAQRADRTAQRVTPP